MRGAEVERILKGDAAVDHFDRLNLDRALRTGSLFLARFALHERAQVPSSIRHLRADDVGPRQAHRADDHALLVQLADAVVERDLIDADQRVAAARQADIAELQTSKQRAFEPADRQGGRQVRVGLTHDLLADAVLRPAGFNDPDADADQDEDERDQPNEYSRQYGRDGSKSSKERHVKGSLSTAVPPG